MSAYTEQKAAERGKSFARQVWETIFVAAFIGAALGYLAYRIGMPA